MLRKSRFLLGFAAILPGLSGCGAKNRVCPAPPSGRDGGEPGPASRDRLRGIDRHDAGEGQGRPQGPRQRLPAEHQLRGRRDRQGRRPALRHRRAAVPGGAQGGPGEAGRGRGEPQRGPGVQASRGRPGGLARRPGQRARLPAQRGPRAPPGGARRQAREEYDRQAADYKAAQAVVEARQADLQQAEVDFKSSIALAEASVENARAAVTTAELDVSYTKIVAPIGGRIGRHLVDVGNLVQSETTLLATIESTDPIYVYFTLSESQVLYFTRLRQQNKLPAYRDLDDRAPDGARRRGRIPARGPAGLRRAGRRPRHRDHVATRDLPQPGRLARPRAVRPRPRGRRRSRPPACSSPSGPWGRTSRAGMSWWSTTRTSSSTARSPRGSSSRACASSSRA